MKSELLNQMKENYEKNDVEKCITNLLLLVMIYNKQIKDGIPYNHDLKHLLFKSNFIRNPMGMKYTKDDYEKTTRILIEIIQIIRGIGDEDSDALDELEKELLLDERITKDIITMSVYTECFYKMNSINSRRIEESAFSQIVFVEQLISILVFYQDQIRLLRKKYSDFSGQDYLTGLELLVSDQQVQYYDEIKCSIIDNQEAMLESINELVHYLYYRYGNELKTEIKDADVNVELIHPYENKKYEEYFYIADQRHLMKRVEEGIRYGYYDFEDMHREQNGSIMYAFSLEDEEKYKARSIGIFRREYQIRSFMMMAANSSMTLQLENEQLMLLAEELLKTQCEENTFLNINDFHPDKDTFFKAEGVAKIKEAVVETLTKTYYLDLDVKSVNIRDLLVTYRYLYTLSEIKYIVSLKMINEENQSTYMKELSIVNITYLVSELSRIHGYEKAYAEKLIDRFVFHEKKNRDDDIFAQPLLKISKSQVILSQALIEQVNLDRFIERQFIRFKKDVSEVGHIFEKEFIESLVRGYSNTVLNVEHKNIPNFSVNTNNVMYDAFDGKQIEFDVIAVLGDYLVLTELKAIMTSYELNELEERKRNVKEAVAQLQRRAESVKYDWEKIRERVSIELPEIPYDEEHIILVACTDAYDYTPLKYENVFVTDESTFLKYFTNPYVSAIQSGEGQAEIYNFKNLWKKGYPEANEFMEYLKNPITTQAFSDAIEKVFLPVPVIDEKDYGIWCEQYRLKEDPMKKTYETVKKKTLGLSNQFLRKVYPNEPCPCGSGKKYKRCCRR